MGPEKERKRKLTGLTDNVQVLFAYVMVYATGVSFTKFSILMFYRRIFGDQIRISLWICSFFVIGYWVTVCVTILVACRPIPYFWTRYTDPTAVGTCIDVPSFFFGNGIAAMLIDVMILVVPIPVVNSLNMHRGQKKAVIGILLLGGLYVPIPFHFPTSLSSSTSPGSSLTLGV
jgi:hypothetical protein